MGVHTTFVRSVDLDEWTQRQIDAMRLGGNANCGAYLRKHGFSDMHGKVEKKYKSKASQAYRAELAKLVEAQAAKRGEMTNATATDESNLLLENLSVADQKEQQDLARQTIAAAASAAKTSAPVLPTAKLASQLPGAKGRLATPPSSGNGPKLVLRKLSSGASSTTSAGKNLLKKKKPTSTVAKLRVNKLSTTANDDAGFDDIDATPPPEEPKVEAPPVPAPVVVPVVPPPVASPKPPVSPASAPPKAATMDESMAKLKAMNNDFFAGM